MLERMRRIWRFPPQRAKDFKGDLPAGLLGGLAALPTGLAAGVMAGVNPLHGIYASVFGRIAGGLSTGSALMCVTTTGAISITIAETMGGIPEAQQAGALAMLVLLVGLIQLALGLLRLGFLVHFVSNTVTTGFLAGIAVTIVLSQLGDLAGYTSDAEHRLLQVYDLATHLAQVHLPTLLVGGLTIITVMLLDRTRLSGVAMIIALALAAGVTHGFGLDEVGLVSDTYPVPSALPLPILPDVRFLPQVTFTAVAVAVVGLLQGAGVSHSYPNPNGRYPNPSVDFRGQGIANLACALLRGLPVGGSFGQTALLVNAGARTRWATLLSGLTAALAILLLAPVVGALPLAAVAGLLVVVGARAFPIEQVQVIWLSGWINAMVMGMTFVTTLLLPIEQAVALGVMVTFGLQVFRAANRLQLRELRLRADGRYEERDPPAVLASREICVLYPNGSLFFAGAQVLESQLPDPNGADRPMVALLLRGRKEVGSTFIGVIARYARRLRRRGGRLLLVGVSEHVRWQLEHTRLLKSLGPENVFLATPVVGEALMQARCAAQAWLDATEPPPNTAEESTDFP
jgi:SulP family sulfate permease